MRFAPAAALAALIVTGSGIAHAEPGGCLKYGAGGAVAGHLAHHHAVLGAVGGCAVGAWRRHEYRKHERALEQAHRQGYEEGSRER